MKLHNIVAVAAIVVLAMVPLTAEAKKRHSPRHGASTLTFLEVLKYCRQKYGNGYDVNVFKRSGKWICEYRGN